MDGTSRNFQSALDSYHDNIHQPSPAFDDKRQYNNTGIQNVNSMHTNGQSTTHGQVENINTHEYKDNNRMQSQFQNQQTQQFQQSSPVQNNQFQQSTNQSNNQFQRSTPQQANQFQRAPPLDQFQKSQPSAKSISSNQFSPRHQLNEKIPRPEINHPQLASTALSTVTPTVLIANTKVSQISAPNSTISSTGIVDSSSQHDFSPPSRSDIDKLPDSIIYDNVDFGNCRSAAATSACTTSSIPSYSSFKDYDNPFASSATPVISAKPRQSPSVCSRNAAYNPQMKSSTSFPMTGKKSTSGTPEAKRNSYPLLVDNSSGVVKTRSSTINLSSQTSAPIKRNSFPTSRADSNISSMSRSTTSPYTAGNLTTGGPINVSGGSLVAINDIYDNVVLPVVDQRGGSAATNANRQRLSMAQKAEGEVSGMASTGNYGKPSQLNQSKQASYDPVVTVFGGTSGASSVKFANGGEVANTKVNNNFNPGSVAKISPYNGATGGVGSRAGAQQTHTPQVSSQIKPHSEISQAGTNGQEHCVISKQLNQAIDDLEKINFNVSVSVIVYECTQIIIELWHIVLTFDRPLTPSHTILIIITNCTLIEVQLIVSTNN